MERVQDLINETAASILNSPAKRHPPETWWSSHQPFLAECGYMLRPRYHPNWIPSWFGSSKNPRKCEDSIPTPVMRAYHWMDAIKMAENAPVLLKRVRVLPPPSAPAANETGKVSREQSQRSGKMGREGRQPYPSPSQTEVNNSTSNGVNMNTSRSANEQKALKEVQDPDEVLIINFFASSAVVHHPLNHCAPLLDIFDLPRGNVQPTDLILAMPLLRPFNDPPFQTVGEGLDFIKQALDAVHFLHIHHVAHRDCGSASFMYDPSLMYPEGYHPVMIHMTRDLKRRAKHYSRTEYPPMYYITNFTHAKRYQRSEGILESPVIASDTSVPEFQGSKFRQRHDPFATDVYLLGNLIRNEFMEGKNGFDFLGPFVETMVQRDPIRRPTMQQCVDRFFTICAYQPKSFLRKRFISGPEAEGARIINNVSHMFRTVKYSVLGIPPAYTYAGKSPYPPARSMTYNGTEPHFSSLSERKFREPNYHTSRESIPQYPFNLPPTPSYPAQVPQRSHSFSHRSREASMGREFARQQNIHKKRMMETASYESRSRYDSDSSTNYPASYNRDLSRAGTSSSRHRILLNNYPGQNRTRTTSDSGYFGPRVVSPTPMYPIIAPSVIPTKPYYKIHTLNLPPSTPPSRRGTPTHTPVPAQKYVLASPPAEVNGGHNRGHTRTNTNETENTDTTQMESISSVSQTQETYVENRDLRPAELNADVSHLDLEQDIPDSASIDDHTKNSHQDREQGRIDKEQMITQTPTPKPEEREVKSKSKSKSRRKSKHDTIDSTTIEKHPHSKSKSKSRSRQVTKDTDTNTVHTRNTEDFRSRFPEIGELTPLLSATYGPNGHRRSSSPAPRSPVASEVPASLLTGPALADREGSIHSIPDPENLETAAFIDEKAKNGQEFRVDQENRISHERPHKRTSGGHHRHSQTNGSIPIKDRSTKWDCTVCSQHLSNKATSIAHMQREHPAYHICLRCGSYYTSAEHLDRHQAKRGHRNNVSETRNDDHYEFPGSFNHGQPF